MNSNPLVTVIIPTYNRASTICRAIESVLKQTYSNIELIIVDDGSTDETKLLLKQYKQNENLKIIETTNLGVSCARNLGVARAKGDYISFLDSDDEWLPGKLSSQIPLLKDYEWVHTEEIWIRNGVRVNPMKKHQKGAGNLFVSSLKLCLVSPSTVLMSKKIFTEFCGFREDFVVCEDYDLWLKLFTKYAIGYVSSPQIIKYGGHDDQLSRKYFAMDYFRAKSIAWILKNMTINKTQHEEAKKVLLKKCEILLKGYQKHQNFENYQEVDALYNAWK